MKDALKFSTSLERKRMKLLSDAEIETIIQDLLDIAPYAEIAHHIPGRIRLKISISGLNVFLEKDIQYSLGHIPGVISMRMKPLARSAVIEYDQEKLPYDFWTSLGKSDTKPGQAKTVGTHLRVLFNGERSSIRQRQGAPDARETSK